MTTIDQHADCATCNQLIEYYAGIPGSEWHLPYWRHIDGPRPHAAKPDEASIREVAK